MFPILTLALVHSRRVLIVALEKEGKELQIAKETQKLNW